MADDDFDWFTFFIAAGIPEDQANAYADIFEDNRIRETMLADLTRDILQELGVVVMGDVLAILKQAKAYEARKKALEMQNVKAQAKAAARQHVNKRAATSASSVPLQEPTPPAVPEAFVSLVDTFSPAADDADQDELPSKKVKPASSGATQGTVASSIASASPKSVFERIAQKKTRSVKGRGTVKAFTVMGQTSTTVTTSSASAQQHVPTSALASSTTQSQPREQAGRVQPASVMASAAAQQGTKLPASQRLGGRNGTTTSAAQPASARNSLPHGGVSSSMASQQQAKRSSVFSRLG